VTNRCSDKPGQCCSDDPTHDLDHYAVAARVLRLCGLEREESEAPDIFNARVALLVASRQQGLRIGFVQV
jgi:hypothetical protein